MSAADGEVVAEGVASSEKRGILPSVTDKIRESVNFGSVFLALDKNFFTIEALLEWLTTVPLTEETQIAYKAVCLKIPPIAQYLSDSWHFLVKKPEYTSLAVNYDFNPEASDQKDAKTNNPIVAHLCEALMRLNGDADLRRLSALILTGDGNAKFIRSKLATCYKARSFPHLRHTTGHELNVALVQADWTTKFRYNEQLPGLIIQHVAKLQEQAPVYYAEVAFQAYNKVAVKLNKDKLLTRLTRDELITFNTFFPRIVDTRILDYSPLAYKIALLGNDVAGYVLGFPIQSMIPGENQIHQAVTFLTEQGADKYAEFIRGYVAKTYVPVLPFPIEAPPIFPNETDVIFENIDNYVPFDIIACQIGPHVHRFSRGEVDKLLETKKNHWNKEWLPPTVLSTLQARQKAAKELGLPPARPLCELLDRVEAGTLFEPDAGPKSAPHSPSEEVAFEAAPQGLLRSLLGEWAPGLPEEMVSSGPSVPSMMIPLPPEPISPIAGPRFIFGSRRHRRSRDSLLGPPMAPSSLPHNLFIDSTSSARDEDSGPVLPYAAEEDDIYAAAEREGLVPYTPSVDEAPVLLPMDDLLESGEIVESGQDDYVPLEPPGGGGETGGNAALLDVMDEDDPAAQGELNLEDIPDFQTFASLLGVWAEAADAANTPNSADSTQQ
jgi:hypothetical protein